MSFCAFFRYVHLSAKLVCQLSLSLLLFFLSGNVSAQSLDPGELFFDSGDGCLNDNSVVIEGNEFVRIYGTPALHYSGTVSYVWEYSLDRGATWHLTDSVGYNYTPGQYETAHGIILGFNGWYYRRGAIDSTAPTDTAWTPKLLKVFSIEDFSCAVASIAGKDFWVTKGVMNDFEEYTYTQQIQLPSHEKYGLKIVTETPNTHVTGHFFDVSDSVFTLSINLKRHSWVNSSYSSTDKPWYLYNYNSGQWFDKSSANLIDPLPDYNWNISDWWNMAPGTNTPVDGNANVYYYVYDDQPFLGFDQWGSPVYQYPASEWFPSYEFQYAFETRAEAIAKLAELQHWTDYLNSAKYEAYLITGNWNDTVYASAPSAGFDAHTEIDPFSSKQNMAYWYELLTNLEATWVDIDTVFANPGLHTILLSPAQLAAIELTDYFDFGIADEMVTAPRSLRLLSDYDVALYAYTLVPYTSDATTVLPIEGLDKEYYVVDYDSGPWGRFRMFHILATEDNTTVRIELRRNGVTDGTEIVTLNRGDVYSVKMLADPTGTHITAIKPVAVYIAGGIENVPISICCADQFYEQMLSVNRWGRTFYVPNTVQNMVRYRVIASEPNTVVEYTNSTPKTVTGAITGSSTSVVLQPGEFTELETSTGGAYIHSQKHLAVVAYLVDNGYANSSTEGDPSIAWIPPMDQGLTQAIIAPNVTLTSQVVRHYALIVTRTAAKDNTTVAVNGGAAQTLASMFASLVWTDNAESGLSCTSVLLYSGAPENYDGSYYTFANPAKLTVSVYGLGPDESYWQLGDMAIRDLDFSLEINNSLDVSIDYEVCEGTQHFHADVPEGVDSNIATLTWSINGEDVPSLTDKYDWLSSELPICDAGGSLPIGEYIISATMLHDGTEYCFHEKFKVTCCTQTCVVTPGTVDQWGIPSPDVYQIENSDFIYTVRIPERENPASLLDSIVVPLSRFRRIASLDVTLNKVVDNAGNTIDLSAAPLPVNGIQFGAVNPDSSYHSFITESLSTYDPSVDATLGGLVNGISGRAFPRSVLNPNQLSMNIPVSGLGASYTLTRNGKTTLIPGYEYWFEMAYQGMDDCEDTVSFRIKAVPDTIVWRPVGTNSGTPLPSGNSQFAWNNDLNWKYQPYPLQRDAAPPTAAFTNAFTPLPETHVIIPDVSDVYPVLRDVDILTYDHATQSFISGYAETDFIEYDYNFRPNAASHIHFKQNGELGNPFHLSYDSAYVDLKLNTVRWYGLSAPLRNLYTGDYMFERANPLSEIRLYNNVNPQNNLYEANWTASFNNTNFELKAGYGYALRIGSKYFSSSDFKPNPDKGVTDPDIATGTPWTTAGFYFPYASMWHRFYDATTKEYTGRTDAIPTGGRQFGKRFVYEIDQAVSGGTVSVAPPTNELVEIQLNKTVSASGALVDRPVSNGSIVFVGNPFMSHLDFNEFYFENQDLIADEYHILQSSGAGLEFASLVFDIDGVPISTTGGLTSISIPPMQSFAVKVNKTSAIDDNDKLKITKAMSVTDDTHSLLRAAPAERDILRITAARGTQHTSAVIALRERARNEVVTSEDSHRLFIGSETNAPTAPTVFTITDGAYLDINRMNTLPDVLPIGIITSVKGETTISVSGISTLTQAQSLYLRDAAANAELPIEDDGFSYTFNNTEGNLFGRFSIMKSATDVNRIEAVPKILSVYSYGGRIHIVSPDGDEIRDVSIYGLNGGKLYQRRNTGESHVEIDLQKGGNPIVIVKACTDNITAVKKVLNK